MKLAVLLLLLAACHSSAGDDFPIGPGGEGGGPVIVGPGGGGGGDGGIDGGDGDGGVPLSGRVCIPLDVRKLTVCDDAADASGLTVTLGTRTTVTTAKTGVFTIAAPQGAGFTWHVTGAKFITSVMPFGTTNTIPVIGDTQYTELLVANSTLIQDQQGSVFVRVVSGVTPVSGVIASSNPPANDLAFYDSNDPARWDTLHTETNGVAWFPGLPVAPSPAVITLSPPGAAAVTVSVVVENQAITFVTKDFQ